jgi:hypothetical protein
VSHGFVYVLGNESMPGIYKIGFTLKHPRERMAELSRATACPTPFDLLAFIGCEDPQKVEAEIHGALTRFRVNHAREFFRADPSWIQDLLREHGDPHSDAFCDGDLEWEIWQHDRSKRQEALMNLFLGQNADPIDWTPRGFE